MSRRVAEIDSEGEVSGESVQRHRPLAPLLVGFAGGIALDAWADLSGISWVIMALGLMAAGMWITVRGGARTTNGVIACLLLIALGGGWHSYREQANSDPRLMSLLSGDRGTGKNLRIVRARVTRDPELFCWTRPFGKQVREKWRCEVDLYAAMAADKEWVRVSGGITVLGEFPVPGVTTGDYVEFPAELTNNPDPTNPGETDYGAIFRRKGSYGTASVQSGEAVKLIERAPWYSSLRVLLGRLRSVVKQKLVWEQKEKFNPLTTALILGERGGFTRPEWQLMAEAGSIHFLAISGLHVGLFAGFMWIVLGGVAFPYRWRPLVLIGAVWGYVLFVGSPVSARRAGWMITFVAGSPLLHRRRDSVSAVLAAAFIILLMQPAELFSVGFQFTFTAVMALLFLFPQIQRIVWPWRGVVERIQQPSERLFSEDVRDLAGRYMALSICIWVSLLPLTVFHFNRLSLLTPVINLVLWPLALLLIGGSLALIPVAVILPRLVGPGLSVTGWLAGEIHSILQLFSRLPGFVVYVPSPPFWWITGCYIVMAVWIWRRKICWGRKLFIAGVVVLGLSYGMSDLWNADKEEGLKVTVTDVGHGQCVVFNLPDDRAMVYDAGSSSGSRAHIAGSVLWEERVRRIGALIVSHRDADHSNFVPYLNRRFDVDKFFIPPLQSGVELGSVEEAFRKMPADRVPLMDGVRLRGQGLTASCLHPDETFLSYSGMDDNNCSAVMMCAYKGWRILLTGDIGEAGIQHLITRHPQRIKADVVILPHHGAWADNLRAFLRVTDPRLILVSTDGELPLETGQMLEGFGRPVWSTHHEGAITLHVRDPGVSVKGYVSNRSMRIPSSVSETP